MGTPIASMLLGQAAPVQKDVSQMTAEELSAYVKSLNAGNPPPEPTPTPTPAPVPAPAQGAGQPGYIARFLSAIGLLPSTASLAAPLPTPAPLTPEQLAERNRRLAGGQ